MTTHIADQTSAAHPLSHLTAQDVMTGDVATVVASATIEQAMTLMRNLGVRHLPVLEDGLFAGIVDDRMLAVALRTDDGATSPLEQTVKASVTHYVPQVPPNADLQRVANLLRTSRCDAVAVVDAGDHLMGIITMVDVVGAVARAAEVDPARAAGMTNNDPFTAALDAAITPSTYLDAMHRAVVHAATLAPSVHNSQPWRFTKDDDGLDLYADDGRRLPVLDPEGRLVHMSCGAALLHAQVAVRALGFNGGVRLLPDPADPAHLARLQITAGPLGSGPERALADAILLRHTHRDVFDEQRLPQALLTTLRVAAEEHGASLVTIDSPDDLIELEVLLAWADGLEEANPAYRAELAASLRTGPSSDGIPTSALPADPERGSSLRLRDFGLGDARPSGGEPPVAEKPDVVVIVTDGDGPLSWLQAGQALGAVLLHSAKAGVMGQPLAQATDFPAARARLRKALGLVGTPQMALRLGYAAGTACTPRRDVDDVLVAAAPPG